MRLPSLRSPVALVALATLASPSVADIVVVGSPGSFTDLQQAVWAAEDGGVLVLGAGVYGSCRIAGKSLRLHAYPGAQVQVEGTVEVTGVGEDQSVVMTGISITGREVVDLSETALEVWDCEGAVQLYDCALEGGQGYAENTYSYYTLGSGGAALRATDADRVLLVRCSVTGGRGGADSYQSYACAGGDGGFGVDALGSIVVLFDSIVRGGDGGDCGSIGGRGGDALSAAGGGGGFTSGSSFFGGDGVRPGTSSPTRTVRGGTGCSSTGEPGPGSSTAPSPAGPRGTPAARTWTARTACPAPGTGSSST